MVKKKLRQHIQRLKPLCENKMRLSRMVGKAAQSYIENKTNYSDFAIILQLICRVFDRSVGKDESVKI